MIKNCLKNIVIFIKISRDFTVPKNIRFLFIKDTSIITTTDTTTESTTQLTSTLSTTKYTTQLTTMASTSLPTTQLTTLESTIMSTTQLTSLISSSSLSSLAFTASDNFYNNSVVLKFFSSLFGTNSTNLNFTQALSILSNQKGNLNGCLQNCYSSGICSINNGFLGCQCFQYFTGTSCQFDTRPCASNPCLNNGTCINNLNGTIYSFECQCKNTFYGLNCENHINICQNVTCSNHGYCYTEQNIASCKCFTSYSGDSCEIASSHVKLVKSVQLSSTIICFVVLSLLILSVISNDTFNYFTRTNNKKNEEKVMKRFKYHN